MLAITIVVNVVGNVVDSNAHLLTHITRCDPEREPERREASERRRELRWSVNEVARRLGMPYTTVYKWEKGINHPTRRNMELWEQVLQNKQEADSQETEYLKMLVKSQQEQIEMLKSEIERLRNGKT